MSIFVFLRVIVRLAFLAAFIDIVDSGDNANRIIHKIAIVGFMICRFVFRFAKLECGIIIAKFTMIEI